MARVSASIVFDLLARDRGASRTIRGVGDAATESGSKLAAFGGFLFGVAKKGAIALGALGVTGATMGVKTAAGLEQAQIAFETLLGSGQKAQRFLNQLQDFAAKTPFELPGLISAARQLIGVGQSANSVIPTLRAWGDTAGALGLSQEQFERALTAVTQSMAKGKVQAEELMQITEAGVPIWPLLSRALGKPVPKLQELASEGKLLAKDVFPALEKQMNKDYGGAMAKQSQTLTGLWSTLMDELNIGLAQAVQPLLPALKTGLAQSIKFVGQALAAVPPIIEQVKAALPGFISNLRNTGGATTQLKGIWDTLRNAWQQIAPVLANVGRQIMATVQPALREIVAVIRGQVFPALKAFIPAVTPVVKWLIKFLGGVLVDTIKAAVSVIKGALKIIAGLFNVFAGLLTGDWSRLWKGLKQIASGLLQGIWGLVKLIVLSKLGAVFKLGGRLLTSLWRAAWNRLKGAASSGVSAVLGVVKRIPGLIGRALAGLGKLLYNAGKNAVQGLINGLASKIRALGNMASSLAQKVRNVWPFSPAKEGPLRTHPLDKAGANIAQQVATGMQRGEPKVARAAAGIAGSTLAGAGSTPFGRVAAATAGGGRQVVEIRLSGGGSGLERMFLSWLQGALRNNPGVRLVTN